MTSGKTRKLAAIMFTDMVGYTALMQEDEQKAKSLRDRHRKVLNDSVSRHHGNTIQYYGDGTLTIFSSSIEAVGCAVEVQSEFCQDPKVPLRIGIHSGDVVHDVEGIYGDGVNIASRVESLAISGSVLISEKVYDDLKNHPAFEVKSLGSFDFKNVKKSIKIYAVKSGALKVPSKQELDGKTKKSYKSIAVLPFVNMSSDPENEYFSDGITEEILNALTRVESLQVTSRTSAFAFKNQNVDIRSIGEQLNVKTVLEGSVRKAGNKVRVTAQLINAADGYHIWSEVYDRQLEDIFAVQDEISLKIANKLKETLGTKEMKDSLLSRRTKNLDGYKTYLKGLYYINKHTPEGLHKAIELLNQAIEIDPEFPLPYTQLSYAYGFLGVTGQVKSSIAFPISMENAEKAMKLDDSIYESHLSFAIAELYFYGNLKKSYTHFQNAFKLNSGASVLHQFYAIYLICIGNVREAKESMEKALELDPLSLTLMNWYGHVLLVSHDYEEAIRNYNTILEMDPEFRSALEGRGWAQLCNGEEQEALESFQLYHKKTGAPDKGLAGLGYMYARLGDSDKAREFVDLLIERQEREPNSSVDTDLAIVYAGLKEYDKVIHYTESVLSERKGVAYFLSHPMWDEAKKNETFRAFLENFEEETGIVVFI